MNEASDPNQKSQPTDADPQVSADPSQSLDAKISELPTQTNFPMVVEMGTASTLSRPQAPSAATRQRVPQTVDQGDDTTRGPNPTLEPGAEPIPGYRLSHRLGRGGFGEAWAATAPGNVEVALKFVRTSTERADPELRALELIRNVRHAHLLDIQFSRQIGEYLVLAMPLCEESLAIRFERYRGEGKRGLPTAELLNYMEEAAKALDFLNEPRHLGSDGKLVGIQHRDIKPHNIFLVGGSVRVADFGLAKVLEKSQGAHSGPMTIQFAAPEMFGGKIAPQSDQYSLAVTYVKLRTGHLPFDGDQASVMYGHLNEHPNLEGVTPAEFNVLDRALAKEPSARYANCRLFVEALKSALAVTVPPRGAPHPETQDDLSSVKPPRSFLGGIPFFALGVLILVAVVLYSAMRPTSQRADHTMELEIDPENKQKKVNQIPRPSQDTNISSRTDSTNFNNSPQNLPGMNDVQSAPSQEKNREMELPNNRKNVTPAKTMAKSVASKAREQGKTDNTSLREAAFAQAATLAPAELAGRGYAFLQQYCYQCHGVDYKASDLNVLERAALVANRGPKHKNYVVAGKPDESRLWLRVRQEEMPPEESPQPDTQARAEFHAWIAAGAAFPETERRDPISRRLVLDAIQAHLKDLPDDAQPYQRFFSLTHLYNNPEVRPEELRLYRAAFAKALNSLSWRHELIVPKALDNARTLFAIDLRDVDWNPIDQWNVLLKEYPYGLIREDVQDQLVANRAKDIQTRTDAMVFELRADWFVARATRPALYHQLLHLPDNAKRLEEKLKIHVEDDFLHGKLARAGINNSGVSQHHRIIDRHASTYGAYWRSYDFQSSTGVGNILEYPLGPIFSNNPFGAQAFRHDGGEIIFSLPNGLQGYLLVDGAGKRIDAGPIGVVSDRFNSSGNPTIVNGISCMGCHKLGMLPLRDMVRDHFPPNRQGRQKVEQLFLPAEQMEQKLQSDRDRFSQALAQLVGRYLFLDEDQKQPLSAFPEPITHSARRYQRSLNVHDVAQELELDVPTLLLKIEHNPSLRELGLAPLRDGGTLKRELWDTRALGPSLFQKVALELELGIPHLEQ